MAKKKASPARPGSAKKSGKKKLAAKTSRTSTKGALKKAAAKPASPKTKATQAAAKAATRAKAPPAKRTAAGLGRPMITADEPLYMVFKEDFHARQIFEFLQVRTVRELEEHPPKEIFDRLTRPVRESVDRIRRFLAERNRCLAGDEQFALDHKARMQAQADLGRSS